MFLYKILLKLLIKLIYKLNRDYVILNYLILESKNILTGAAGFIGYYTSLKLIREGFNVLGLDNLNSIMNFLLKKGLSKFRSYLRGIKIDGSLLRQYGDKELLLNTFKNFQPSIVINLAAQAGVRYSITNPSAYINSNIVGFSNILDCCRTFKIENLLYASNSSVYRGNTKIPFEETDPTNHPISYMLPQKI